MIITGQVLRERIIKFFSHLREANMILNPKTFKLTDLYTKTELDAIHKYEKKVDNTTYTGQKKVFADAKKGKQEAIDSIFLKQERGIMSTFWNNFLGKNSKMRGKRINNEDALADWIGIVYDTFREGYSAELNNFNGDQRADATKGKDKAAWEKRQYKGIGALQAFDPNIFDKHPTDLYEKFGYYFNKYIMMAASAVNNKTASGGIHSDLEDKRAGYHADKVRTQAFDTTYMNQNGEITQSNAADDNTYDPSIKKSLTPEAALESKEIDEDLLDSFMEMSADDRMYEPIKADTEKRKKFGTAPATSSSLAEILVTTFKYMRDIQDGKSPLSDKELNASPAVYLGDRLGISGSTMRLKMEKLQNILKEYDLNLQALQSLVHSGDTQEIIELFDSDRLYRTESKKSGRK